MFQFVRKSGNPWRHVMPFRLVIESTERKNCLTEDENGMKEINDCGDIGSISVENREITRGYRVSERKKKLIKVYEYIFISLTLTKKVKTIKHLLAFILNFAR